MKTNSVRSLFRMFSGEDCAERFEPLIALSVSEVESMLLPEADSDDVRLDFLCAAMANCRAQQILSADNSRQVTYAGKMKSSGNDSTLAYAEKLLRDYMELCSDLISAGGFVFMSFGKGEV